MRRVSQQYNDRKICRNSRQRSHRVRNGALPNDSLGRQRLEERADTSIPYLVAADENNRISELPRYYMAGRSGNRRLMPEMSDCIPLPPGSTLFTMPGRLPVGFNRKSGKLETVSRHGLRAIAAFVAPGYTRTLLPAAATLPEAPVLPLFAYSAVGWRDDRFWVTAFRVDEDTRCDPWHYEDDDALARKVTLRLEQDPKNRLLQQLSRCALEYHCFAAKNVFHRQWECPLPTAMGCNARCLGCISLQPSGCCPASMERLPFRPETAEITAITVPHLQEADRPIASFGQGCEGEPLTEFRLLSEATAAIRHGTTRGTVNLNTNGYSAANIAPIIDAGLDSVRFSLNSLDPHYYTAYYRPVDYSFDDVLDTMSLCAEKKLFISLNLLVHPGFTDRQEEIEALIKLHWRIPFHMIQMRNLNIDPDYYENAIGYSGTGIGIKEMMAELRAALPGLQFGYYNPIKEDYSAWEIFKNYAGTSKATQDS